MFRKNNSCLYYILTILPRKTEGEKLEKVVSTKVTATHFKILEKYARIRYNQNSISQPTISHLLRIIIDSVGGVHTKAGKRSEPQGCIIQPG